MSRSRKSLAGLVVLVVLTLMWAACGEPTPPKPLRITTGTEGGTYFTVGRRLARLLEEYSGAEIGEVEATESRGTIENCRRLASSEADLALAIGPVLANTEDPCVEDIAVVMALYIDRVQIVVQNGIEDLSDLKGKDKTLYIGADLSGNKVTAEKILAVVEISDTDYTRAPPSVISYKNASEALQRNKIDAAFFISATPTEAVSDALGHGCCHLLDLKDHVARIERGVPGLTEQKIPANSYPDQPDLKVTVGANALLIARKLLPEQVVAEILNSLFSHIADLAVASIHVQDVRLETAFDEKSLSGLNLHDGVDAFEAREKRKLRIVTGVLNGKYFNLGKKMELLLRREGISTRVIHTDGSLENLRLLRDSERPTLAIIQYDTALASIWGPEIYGDPVIDLPPQQQESLQLRRIATLHDEVTHILIRRKFLKELAEKGTITVEEQQHPTVHVLKDARVCLGPKESGVRVIADAILKHHGINLEKPVYLSVPDMVERLHSGDLDAGFFVSFVPSEPLKTLVDDQRIRLLSIDTRKSVGLLNAGLRLSKIGTEAGYGSQLEGEPDIDTVATRAVLVASADLPFDDVWQITKALFEGAPLLGVEGGAEAMQENLPGLPLHRGADEYLHPDLDPWGRLERMLAANWKFLASLVILAGGCQALLSLKCERTSKQFRNDILAINLGARARGSVDQLLKLREGHDGDDSSLADRVKMKWWKLRELDHSRWGHLHDLINDRIGQAQENLMRHVAEQLRDAKEEALDPATYRDHLLALKKNILNYLQGGELNASHYRLLLEMIEASLREVAEATEELPPAPASTG